MSGDENATLSLTRSGQPTEAGIWDYMGKEKRGVSAISPRASPLRAGARRARASPRNDVKKGRAANAIMHKDKPING